MFANCDELKDKAKELVRNTDRMLYWPFLEHIEKFAVDNSCYLAGDLAISRIIGKCDVGFCDATYELYCDNVYPTGQRLATELYELKSPFLSSRTVALQTVLKHRELTLSINARILVRMFGMERIRGRKLPYVLPAGPYLPMEALLVGVYRCLYSPCVVARWPELSELESGLFRKYYSGVKDTNLIADQSQWAPLQEELIKHSESIGMYAGEYAVRLLHGDSGAPRRLQFVSSVTADDLRGILYKLARNIAPKVTRVTYVTQSTILFSDPQLHLWTFFAEIPGNNHKLLLCDVWNSSSYELIPTVRTVKEHNNIAHPYVLLKLLFADTWVAMCNDRSPQTAASILRARQYVVDHPECAVCIAESYKGYLITDRAAKKKEVTAEQRLPDFLPGALA